MTNIERFLTHSAKMRPYDEPTGMVNIETMIILQNDLMPRACEMIRLLYNNLQETKHVLNREGEFLSHDRVTDILERLARACGKTEDIAGEAMYPGAESVFTDEEFNRLEHIYSEEEE